MTSSSRPRWQNDHKVSKKSSATRLPVRSAAKTANLPVTGRSDLLTAFCNILQAMAHCFFIVRWQSWRELEIQVAFSYFSSSVSLSPSHRGSSRLPLGGWPAMRKPDVQTMPNRIKPPSQRHQFKKILTSVKQLLESVGSKNLRLTCSRKGREGVPPLWAISPSVMIIMDFGQCPNFYRRITEKWLTPDATIRYVFLQFQEFSDLLVGCGIGHLYLIVLIQIQLTKSAILLWDHKSFRLFRLPRRFGLGSGMVGNTLDCACKLRSTARQELMALS